MVVPCPILVPSSRAIGARAISGAARQAAGPIPGAETRIRKFWAWAASPAINFPICRSYLTAVYTQLGPWRDGYCYHWAGWSAAERTGGCRDKIGVVCQCNSFDERSF